MKNIKVKHNTSYIEITETTKTAVVGTSARARLKSFLLQHPNEVIGIDVLTAVADGPRDWTRQLRLLREDGMELEYIPKNKSLGRNKDGYIYHNTAA